MSASPGLLDREAAQSADVAASARDVTGVVTALRVETPENIVIDYPLAGPTVRCLAYLIDFAVRMGILLVLSVVFTIGGIVWSGGVSLGMLFVLVFVIDWFYYVASEVWYRGRSIGKQALGIRVVDERGYPITFWPSCLRNLLRAVDSMPFLLHGVGFLSILLTRRGQRLGDLVAGTVVITQRSVRLPKEPIILERIEPLPHNEILERFTPSERTLSLIEEFLGRRFVLTHERGHALASVLAAQLAERMNYQGDAKLVQQYPMAFLARVYVTFLKRREEDEFAGTSDSLWDQSSVNLGRV